MAIRPLKSVLPTADDVVNSALPALGRILLVHLKSYEGQGSPVYQHAGGINREYLFAMMERRNIGLGHLPGNEPEYGARQAEVTVALREAWNWLEKEGHLMHTPGQPVQDWFSITRNGEKLLARLALLSDVEKLLDETGDRRANPAWWERARSLIERWNPARSAEAKATEDLFFANHPSGVLDYRGEMQQRREENQMLALLHQARHDLSGYENAVGGGLADAAGMKESQRSAATTNPPAERVELSGKVFIVHGHDEGAREAVARFLERVGLEPIILHEQPNRGRAVIEKFEAHRDVGFAVVLLTPDDEGCEKGGTPRPRARQNVVLELGYFVGALGRERVCVLRRGDVEIPSDFTGVVYVTFDEADG